MPQAPGPVVQVAAVAFGVDDEDPGRADDQVIHVSGRPGDGQVVKDLIAVPLQRSQEASGASFALGSRTCR